jgi:hypothetical protein
MLSEFISEDDRFLELTDDEYEKFKTTFVPAGHEAAGAFEWSKVRMWDGRGEYNDAPLWLKEGEELPRRTRLEFLYGKSAEGYFNSEHFIRQVYGFLMIFEFKYPEYRACSVFDNSPVHKARGPKGLSASDMNLKPGGAQPHQRDTEYTDHKNLHGHGADKKYHQSIGNKGLRQVLEERGVHVGTKTKKVLVEILEEYDDFSQDDFWLDRIFAARPAGHVCIFAPKCHPELQGPIEMCWARVKYYCARRSNHTLPALQAAIPGAFSEANISLDLVQKWFRKGRDYMTVYKQGATGQSADMAQKGVKSHRRALTVRGAEPRERIDVDQIIANTQILTRSYGSDPIRTELNPVRSMLDDIQADLV